MCSEPRCAPRHEQEYGGVSTVQMLAESIDKPSDSEIWVPDIQPYNGAEGAFETLDSAMASVSSSGSIFWSRPGMLDVMCKFSGLVAFPYDELSCPIEFGGASAGLEPPAGLDSVRIHRAHSLALSGNDAPTGSAWVTTDPAPVTTDPRALPCA